MLSCVHQRYTRMRPCVCIIVCVVVGAHGYVTVSSCASSVRVLSWVRMSFARTHDVDVRSADRRFSRAHAVEAGDLYVYKPYDC